MGQRKSVIVDAQANSASSTSVLTPESGVRMDHLGVNPQVREQS